MSCSILLAYPEIHLYVNLLTLKIVTTHILFQPCSSLVHWPPRWSLISWRSCPDDCDRTFWHFAIQIRNLAMEWVWIDDLIRSTDSVLCRSHRCWVRLFVQRHVWITSRSSVSSRSMSSSVFELLLDFPFHRSTPPCPCTVPSFLR